MNNLHFLVFLHSIGFTQKALARIFSQNENYEEFYNSLDCKILVNLGYKEEKIQKILKEKGALDTTEIVNLIDKLNVQIITITHPIYPELLKQTPICPYFLYVRGTLPNHINLLSIVGSRKSTTYSRNVLSNIIPEFVRKGYGVISGGAYGVDSLAHKITLENHGYTLAVFGTGIDRCYPKENKELFIQILESGGALISSFPIGMGPEPYNFPIRNEIVAGLSRGTLITEATEKSGTLITAGLALDFGRDVFAIPGEITKSTSFGANVLIRDGQAKLTINALDILGEYENLTVINNVIEVRNIPELTDPVEKNIYELLTVESLDISSIEDVLKIDISTISYKLSLMEVRGIIEIHIDGRYKITY